MGVKPLSCQTHPICPVRGNMSGCEPLALHARVQSGEPDTAGYPEEGGKCR